MVLQGNVEVERVGAIDEADADESRSARLVLESDDEVARRVRDALHGQARILVDRTGGEQLAARLVLQLDLTLGAQCHDAQAAAPVGRVQLPLGSSVFFVTTTSSQLASSIHNGE